MTEKIRVIFNSTNAKADDELLVYKMNLKIKIGVHIRRNIYYCKETKCKSKFR